MKKCRNKNGEDILLGSVDQQDAVVHLTDEVDVIKRRLS